MADVPEMVARVARAVCRRIGRYAHPIVSESELDEMVSNSWHEKQWVECAQNVISAMREPTDEMAFAGGCSAPAQIDEPGTAETIYEGRVVWRAMIDVALTAKDAQND